MPTEAESFDEGDFTDRQLAAARVAAERVGAVAASVATADPCTLVTTRCALWGVEKVPGWDELMGVVEYGEDPDVNRMSDLVRAPGGISSVVRATGGRPEESRRWREVFAPSGATDELRVLLTARGSIWGTLNLYRNEGAFTDAQIRSAVELAAHLVEPLRRGMLQAILGRRGDRPPGLVQIGPNGSVSPVTESAQTWLALGGAELQEIVRYLASSAASGGPRDTVLTVESGEVFHVHHTSISGKPGAIVEVPRRAVLAERIVRAWGLTARESEVLEHVCHGGSTDEIATSLEISPWTVQDHLKRIFDKSGHSSRRELVAALYLEHALPEIRAGALPGPYGWFQQS